MRPNVSNKQTIGDRIAPVKLGIKEKIGRFFLGEDIFISYSRRDGSLYAAGIADKLTERRLSCFIDKLGTEPNHDLPESLKKKIRSSAVFVLVGTQAAAQSVFVEKEIIEFKKTGRTILPIDFHNAVGKALWYQEIPGIASESEKELEALEKGNPSPNVVSFIEKSFNYTRRNQRMSRMLWGALSVFLILVIASVVAFFIARDQFAKATEATRTAHEQTQKAKDATDLAATKTKEAEAATKLAKDKTKEATDAGKLAQDKTKEARKAAALAEEKTELAAQAETKASAAEARRQISELQDRRTSLVLQARDAFASSNPLNSYTLSRESLELEDQNPKIGNSSPARAVFSQAVNKGLPITYPYFKEVFNLSLHPNGTHIAAIGSSLKDSLENHLMIWTLDGSERYDIPSKVTALEFSPDGDSVIVSDTFKKGEHPKEDDEVVTEFETQIKWLSLKLEQQKEKTITLPSFKVSLKGKDDEPFQVEQIHEIKFTKDKRRIVLSGLAGPITANNTYAYRAWIDLSTHAVNSRIGDGDPYQSVRLSEDSTYLASSSHKEVYLDNMVLGETVLVGTHPTEITGVALSSSAKRIAAIGTDNRVTIFTKTAKAGWEKTDYTLPGTEGARHLVFTDEDRLAIARGDFTVNILPITNKPTPLPEGEVEKNPDQEGVDAYVTALGKNAPATFNGHTGKINMLQVGGDGKWLATASDDKTVRVWRLWERDSREFQGSNGKIELIQFSNDGRLLISAGVDGAIRLWRTEDDFHIVLPANPQESRREYRLTDSDWGAYADAGNYQFKAELGLAQSVKWSPAGNYLASMTYGERLTIWTKDYKVVKSFQTGGDEFYFAGDSWIVTYQNRDPAVETAPAGFDLREIAGDGHLSVTTELTLRPDMFSPDGKWAEIDSSGGLTLHRIKDGVDGMKLAPGTFSPNGVWLAIKKNDDTLLWRLDVSKPRPITLTGSADWIQFSQDGNYLAINPNIINLRNLQRYSFAVNVEQSEKFESISPNGEWFATTNGETGEVSVWPVKGGAPKIFKGHSGRILTMTFSPDSRWLATGGLDRTVRLWSLEGDQVFITEFLNPIEDICFNHDGTRIAAATGTGIKIWFAATGQAQSLLEGTKGILKIK
jgi:WD40 repeat protein